MKKFNCIKNILIVLVLLLSPTPCSCNDAQRTQKPRIDNIYPGQSIEALSIYGMPLPLDTAGWHVFVNIENNTALRLVFEKQGTSWRIKELLLADSGYLGKNIHNCHLILTGRDLGSLNFNGIKPGDEKGKVIRELGISALPKDGNVITYTIEWEQRKYPVIINLLNDRVKSIEIK